MKLTVLTRRFLETVPLALVLFVFWLIFTEKANWHHLLLGAAVSLLVSWLSYHLLAGRLDPHLSAGVAARFPIFAVILFWEIIKANWDVLKRVFAPSMPISPRIVVFESYLESEIAKTILANSITLTPGTVTVEIEEKKFFIHCLAEAHAEDPGQGRLQRLTAWLMREGPADMRRLR